MIRTIIAALVLTTSAQAEDIQWKNLNKQWSIGLTSKACFVRTEYQSNVTFVLRSFSQWTGADLMVCNDRWRLTDGKKYSGRLGFDDGTYPPVNFVAGGSCLSTEKYFGWDSNVLDDLADKKWWQLEMNGKNINPKNMLLSGSKEALWALKQCRGRLSGETFPDQGDTF